MQQSCSTKKYIKVFHTQNKLSLTSAIMTVPSLPMRGPFILSNGTPTASSSSGSLLDTEPQAASFLGEDPSWKCTYTVTKETEYISQPNFKFINLKWSSWTTFEANKEYEKEWDEKPK